MDERSLAQHLMGPSQLRLIIFIGRDCETCAFKQPLDIWSPFVSIRIRIHSIILIGLFVESSEPKSFILQEGLKEIETDVMPDKSIRWRKDMGIL